jgi:hypothetical protein
MNTKKLLLPILLICIALLTASCSLIPGRGLGGGIPGSGNILSESRDTGPFEVIAIEYPGAETFVQQGDKETVEIEADDNLLPQLSTEVVSGRLTIKNMETDWKSTVKPSQPVKIDITVRGLNEIELSAPVGDLELDELQADTLKLVLSGGAQIRINGIQVNLLDTDLSGAGSIQASGTAEEIKLILSGLGSFNATDLESNTATIELSGMGDATVRVEQELAATITGAGSIKYFGNPHVEQNITGAGSIQAAE